MVRKTKLVTTKTLRRGEVLDAVTNGLDVIASHY